MSGATKVTIDFGNSKAVELYPHEERVIFTSVSNRGRNMVDASFDEFLKAVGRKDAPLDSFQVRLTESAHGPGNVLVTEGFEYYDVDGIDVSRLRLPKDPDQLVQVAELIASLLSRLRREHGEFCAMRDPYRGHPCNCGWAPQPTE
jgi:hypothetical protein